jgi:hypothetical protein
MAESVEHDGSLAGGKAATPLPSSHGRYDLDTSDPRHVDAVARCWRNEAQHPGRADLVHMTFDDGTAIAEECRYLPPVLNDVLSQLPLLIGSEPLHFPSTLPRAAIAVSCKRFRTTRSRSGWRPGRPLPPGDSIYYYH